MFCSLNHGAVAFPKSNGGAIRLVRKKDGFFAFRPCSFHFLAIVLEGIHVLMAAAASKDQKVGQHFEIVRQCVIRFLTQLSINQTLRYGAALEGCSTRNE
jgi:hypothetical protein